MIACTFYLDSSWKSMKKDERAHIIKDVSLKFWKSDADMQI